MNALNRLASRIRARCIDLLMAMRDDIDRLVYRLEKKQYASLHSRIARQLAMRVRPPVPEFLRRGRS